jgi:hypothetical protein
MSSLPNPRCLSDAEFAHIADTHLTTDGQPLPLHWQHNAIERIRELLRQAAPVPFFEADAQETDDEIIEAINGRE